MKKFITALSVILFMSGYVTAQIKLGVKAGLNIAYVNNSTANNYAALFGYNTGIVSQFKGNGKLGLTVEALVSQKGYKTTLIPVGTSYNKLTYLSFPVLITYKPVKRLYIQAGPEINYLMNARLKNKSSSSSQLANYKKFDFALAGGLGYALFKNCNLEARYSNSLSLINSSASSSGDAYNKVFQLNLVYFFK